MIQIKENGWINAKDIYSFVEVRTRFNDWIKRCINYADLQEGEDYYSKLGKSTGGKPPTIFYFSIDAAKEVCIVSATSKAKKLRRWLISLSKRHESGLAFTAPQVEALIDLSRAMTLVSIQKKVERKHFDLYNHPQTWWNYRAALLGYSKESLIEAMKEVNKKHRSIRTSLLQLDANELIRTGVIDFMIAMGETNEYATNVGNLCKSMASKMKLGDIIWDDKKDNPIGINKKDVNERKELFSNATKGLPE